MQFGKLLGCHHIIGALLIGVVVENSSLGRTYCTREYTLDSQDDCFKSDTIYDMNAAWCVQHIFVRIEVVGLLPQSLQLCVSRR